MGYSSFLRKTAFWRKRWLRLPFLALLTACLSMTPVWGLETPNPAISQSVAVNLVQQGREFYSVGRYPEAIDNLKQALRDYQETGDTLQQAMVLSNLSLAYQQLGQWTEAESAITESLKLLQSTSSSETPSILAQTLNIQGRLQLAQGEAEKALETWEQAEKVYQQIGDNLGAIRTQINQAQALQALGFYRRALDVLTTVREGLEKQPDSSVKVVALRSLGEILRLVGEFPASETVLQESLNKAQSLNSPEEVSAAYFSLGNLARAQGNVAEALELYGKATNTAPSEMTKVQAQLNQLSLLLEKDQRNPAKQLVAQIRPQVNQLPSSRTGINAQINFANSLQKLASQDNIQESAQLLAKAAKQAKDLGDARSESYALGSLGGLYETTHQHKEAQDLTQKALGIAQAIKASDIAYRWQWQLGRLMKEEGDSQSAIAAYSQAVDTLSSLRGDLVAINSEVQFSFRESVEPVYRQLVSLLLEDPNVPPERIEKARKVIESLQLAELDNFFRTACINAQPVPIDQIDAKAAVFYPIILADRLEVVLSVPGQPLRHYATNLPQEDIENTLNNLRESLTQINRRAFRQYSAQVYDWLIRPAENDLANHPVDTLVFVLDGALRNVPVAPLYDGEKYLVEKYALAITPGLELTEPQSLKRGRLKVLTGGLTEARQGFSPLPNVEFELQQIQSELPAQILLNSEFTKENVQKNINDADFPIVHLATHGQFSSNAEGTFILTWDSQINVKEFNNLFQTQDLRSTNPIQLLVLSACETAKGDKRAALGLAGVAVRAGVGSTVATLWQVEDEATSALMSRFYEELNNPDITKAEALRRAQLYILQESSYRHHPFFWSPFVIIGNWM